MPALVGYSALEGFGQNIGLSYYTFIIRDRLRFRYVR